MVSVGQSNKVCKRDLWYDERLCAACESPAEIIPKYITWYTWVVAVSISCRCYGLFQLATASIDWFPRRSQPPPLRAKSSVNIKSSFRLSIDSPGPSRICWTTEEPHDTILHVRFSHSRLTKPGKHQRAEYLQQQFAAFILSTSL